MSRTRLEDSQVDRLRDAGFGLHRVEDTATSPRPVRTPGKREVYFEADDWVADVLNLLPNDGPVSKATLQAIARDSTLCEAFETAYDLDAIGVQVLRQAYERTHRIAMFDSLGGLNRMYPPPEDVPMDGRDKRARVQ